MRIALVHNNGPGGASRALAEIARGLEKRGHSVKTWTLDYRPLVDLGQLSVASSPLGALEGFRIGRAYEALARAVNAERPDVVLTGGCRYVQQPRVHTLLEAPSVCYVFEYHRAAHEWPRGAAKVVAKGALAPWHAVLARAERREVHAARLSLTLSSFMREHLARRLGLDARVAYPGVDPALFRPLGLARENVVLCPAAVHRRKRQDLLVEALALVPREVRPRLALVYSSSGAGAVAHVEALARARGVELELHANATDEELVRAYNRATLVAYAAEQEPFGLVPLEAMACGVPIVGVAEGGLLETIEPGVTGRLVPPEPAAFARAFVELLRDEPARARLVDAGRARVLERWTWERTTDGVEAALREAQAPRTAS
jgi:glycosyltransferase involved in cell wall biosynthesis